MRYEAKLSAIYNRFLAQPGNSNVPKGCAREAVCEVFHQQEAARPDPVDYSDDYDDVVAWRKRVRLMQQNQWLTRFIRVWEYFEGKA